MRSRTWQKQDSGIDERDEAVVRSIIEEDHLTAVIKIRKERRTCAETNLSTRLEVKPELKKTAKFFTLVTLPPKKDVISVSSFFSRSSDPVVSESKTRNKPDHFDTLNTAVPLTLSKDYNILNKKHCKVDLGNEAMEKLEKYSRKLNKFLLKNGQRKISKPERRMNKCLESASKVKRVKSNLVKYVPVNYQELYTSLISKRSQTDNPRLLKERLESMIDLRYDFNYENRPYYAARKIMNERLKKAKRPPIKLKLSVSRDETADQVDPFEPRNVANSSPAIKSRSTSSDFENVLPTKSLKFVIPRISLKSKTDDPLKKSDQGNVQMEIEEEDDEVIRMEIEEEEERIRMKEKEQSREQNARKEAEERIRVAMEEQDRKKKEKREAQERIRMKEREEARKEQERKEAEERRRMKEKEEAEERQKKEKAARQAKEMQDIEEGIRMGIRKQNEEKERIRMKEQEEQVRKEKERIEAEEKRQMKEREEAEERQRQEEEAQQAKKMEEIQEIARMRIREEVMKENKRKENEARMEKEKNEEEERIRIKEKEEKVRKEKEQKEAEERQRKKEEDARKEKERISAEERQRQKEEEVRKKNEEEEAKERIRMKEREEAEERQRQEEEAQQAKKMEEIQEIARMRIREEVIKENKRKEAEERQKEDEARKEKEKKEEEERIRIKEKEEQDRKEKEQKEAEEKQRKEEEEDARKENERREAEERRRIKEKEEAEEEEARKQKEREEAEERQLQAQQAKEMEEIQERNRMRIREEVLKRKEEEETRQKEDEARREKENKEEEERIRIKEKEEQDRKEKEQKEAEEKQRQKDEEEARKEKEKKEEEERIRMKEKEEAEERQRQEEAAQQAKEMEEIQEIARMRIREEVMKKRQKENEAQKENKRKETEERQIQEEARKKKEREEAAERIRMKREKEKERIERIQKIENERQARETSEKRRMAQEELASKLKEKDEDELAKMRENIVRLKEAVDGTQEITDQLKAFKEQYNANHVATNEVQKENVAGEHEKEIEEPPAKKSKIVRASERESTPEEEDEYLEEDESHVTIFPFCDNSVFPSFEVATNKNFHFDRQKPPKVKRDIPSKSEKEKMFERSYGFKNFKIDTARDEIRKKREALSKPGCGLVFDEDGPAKELLFEASRDNCTKTLNSLFGIDEDNDDDLECVDEWSEEDNLPGTSKDFHVEEKWDYTQITNKSLEKKYKYPFAKTKGLYFPITIKPIKSTMDIEHCADLHVRRFLTDHSCSSVNLALYILAVDSVLESYNFSKNYTTSGEDKNSWDEFKRYDLLESGRFIFRKKYKTVSTNQTREDGRTRNNAGNGEETERENKYLEAKKRSKNWNNKNNYQARKELMCHYVRMSKYDVYSLQDRKYRGVGDRIESKYPNWTFCGYDDLPIFDRNKAFGAEMARLTKDYDGHLNNVYGDQFDKWCCSPMLASLYFQLSKNLTEKSLKPHDFAELKDKRRRYTIMCNSGVPTPLSLIKQMCKLTVVDKKLWSLQLHSLVAPFKELTSFQLLMDRPDYAKGVNNAWRDVLYECYHH